MRSEINNLIRIQLLKILIMRVKHEHSRKILIQRITQQVRHQNTLATTSISSNQDMMTQSKTTINRNRNLQHLRTASKLAQKQRIQRSSQKRNIRSLYLFDLGKKRRQSLRRTRAPARNKSQILQTGKNIITQLGIHQLKLLILLKLQAGNKLQILRRQLRTVQQIKNLQQHLTIRRISN
ncbi:Uncharacterised protein [uncultured archaeon]|nr:Uncharacterised protein [uncultured archaeon]